MQQWFRRRYKPVSNSSNNVVHCCRNRYRRSAMYHNNHLNTTHRSLYFWRDVKYPRIDPFNKTKCVLHSSLLNFNPSTHLSPFKDSHQSQVVFFCAIMLQHFLSQKNGFRTVSRRKWHICTMAHLIEWADPTFYCGLSLHTICHNVTNNNPE